MNIRRIGILLLVFGGLASLAAGCGSCKGKLGDRSTAGAFFPPGARAFVAVDDPGVARVLAGQVESHLGSLASTFLPLRPGEDPLEPLVRELGFDPRTPEGFAGAGIDPGRGMAFGTDDRNRRLAVVGVRDAKAAERWIGEIARRRGAATRTERIFENEEGKKVSIPAFLDGSGTIRIAYTLAGKWLVASEGSDAVDAVGRALFREEAKSLVSTLAYTRSRQKLGEGRAIWGWLPSPQPRARRSGWLAQGFSFGITAGEKDIDVRFRIPQGTLALSVLQSAASVKEKTDHLPYLSERDFLVTRIGGDPVALEPLLRNLFPSTFRQLRRAGLDPAKEILPLLEPGILMGVSLEPDPDLSGGFPTQPSLSTTNPFHFLHTGILATVKDPAKVGAMLERLAEAGERLRMSVTVREVEGLKIYSATYAAGEGLTWALVGDKLLASGGEGAFEALLARVKGEGKAYTPADPEAWQLFSSRPLSLYVDVPRLVEQLRAIPESSFGIGGFRLKAVLDGWIASIESMRGLAVAYSVDDDGVVLDARWSTE